MDEQRKELLKNILEGEKVVCDDKAEYGIGTQEAYDEFVKKRNETLRITPPNKPILE